MMILTDQINKNLKEGIDTNEKSNYYILKKKLKQHINTIHYHLFMYGDLRYDQFKTIYKLV